MSSNPTNQQSALIKHFPPTALPQRGPAEPVASLPPAALMGGTCAGQRRDVLVRDWAVVPTARVNPAVLSLVIAPARAEFFRSSALAWSALTGSAMVPPARAARGRGLGVFRGVPAVWCGVSRCSGSGP